MRIHFIAIGGSAMHNLAIALHKKGWIISGSDDEVFEPSRSRLKQYGLLPEQEGWEPEQITHDLDAVILGMHARPDNPELIRARELGVKIYSYPEYLYEQTKDKTRVVIGGSHGKTTTTSMIMHVLKEAGMPFDYMVGSNIEGFDTMVGLRTDTQIAVFEGDEYLSSPIDPRPKFHHYHPHIALITGIAWDHINVFPTWENYVEQFAFFARSIEPEGALIYFDGDAEVRRIASETRMGIDVIPYATPPSVVENKQTFLIDGTRKIPLELFGEHNLQNIAGARAVCARLGVDDSIFYSAISRFRGSGRRLETVASNDTSTVFYDFAHAPSKLKATTSAVRKQFP
ncbi:MAG TPA: Mur ligase family protein, partial [Prolixibacteraceae bacterium]|nr:Mur ligase family protein [Prolixibacteraceae bacterium]